MCNFEHLNLQWKDEHNWILNMKRELTQLDIIVSFSQQASRPLGSSGSVCEEYKKKHDRFVGPKKSGHKTRGPY